MLLLFCSLAPAEAPTSHKSVQPIVAEDSRRRRGACTYEVFHPFRYLPARDLAPLLSTIDDLTNERLLFFWVATCSLRAESSPQAKSACGLGLENVIALREHVSLFQHLSVPALDEATERMWSADTSRGCQSGHIFETETGWAVSLSCFVAFLGLGRSQSHAEVLFS